MIRINLLPYRQHRRRMQVLAHLALALGMIVLVVIGLGLWHVHLGGIVQQAQDELEQLRQENEAFEQRIGEIKSIDVLRAEVEKKLEIVDRLQTGRFRSLTTLYDLSNRIPAKVWLTRFEDAGEHIRLEGMAESNKAIADFMRAMDDSPHFKEVRLEGVSRQRLAGYTVRQFRLILYRHAVQKGNQETQPVRRGR
ncbi:MAG: fimbrial assembly protein [Zetaproteobacteria bacterium]|nr:MAG: fimbrial assembly protein [Zetaproteobacteria bacterium]